MRGRDSPSKERENILGPRYTDKTAVVEELPDQKLTIRDVL